MKRRNLVLGLVAAGATAPLLIRALPGTALAHPAEPGGKEDDVDMTLEDWKRLLPEDRYRILFREKTEPAWSSGLNDEKRDGTYICAACYQPLFSSDHKFDSGTGWPSFYRPISDDAVGTKRDFKLIWPRTEYHCSRCEGHQGHVFDDGPEPTGQRWCNNGLALEFVPRGEDLPDLRG
ncbi:MAG: peptide-methionine (R)-S-oxide reductase MsrB [Wenzhouxiangellaceae bacterium]|nr:peptide-methionine (R)-S-oxide reductase MsrB [Wenzhouxiangellaceae bacterium]